MALLRVFRNLQVSQARRKPPEATTNGFRVAQKIGVLTTPFCPGGVGCAHPHRLHGDEDKKAAFGLRRFPLRAIPDQ